MTIEERAKKYASKQAIQSYSYCGYFQGATDQDPISRADERKKVIKKVCKLLRNNLPDFFIIAETKDDVGVLFDQDRFIKAMEE